MGVSEPLTNFPGQIVRGGRPGDIPVEFVDPRSSQHELFSIFRQEDATARFLAGLTAHRDRMELERIEQQRFVKAYRPKRELPKVGGRSWATIGAATGLSFLIGVLWFQAGIPPWGTWLGQFGCVLAVDRVWTALFGRRKEAT